MKLLIDASVAVKWFVAESGANDALAILDRNDLCFSPNLIVAELANALNKKRNLGHICTDQMHLAITSLPGMIKFIDDRDIVGRALVFAADLQHPVYDCFYLSAAVHIGATMVTADAIFHKKPVEFGLGGIVRFPGTENKKLLAETSIAQAPGLSKNPGEG